MNNDLAIGCMTAMGNGSASSLVSPGAPNYLPTLSTTRYAAFGVQRVVPGYTGNLFQLRRTTDGVMLDVAPQPGGDYPDYAVIATWLGTGSATVATWYDQSGNARHLTQATAANQPFYDPASAVGGVIPITFASSGATQSLVGTGWALDRIAHSVFAGHWGLHAWDGRSLWSFADAAGTTNYQNVYAAAGRLGTVFDLATSPAFVAPVQNSPIGYQQVMRPRAIGFTNTPTASTFYVNQTTASGTHAAQSTLTMPRFQLGTTTNNNLDNQGAFFSLVIYASGLGSADALAVTSAIRTAHGFDPLTSFDYNLVFDGDSILNGNALYISGLRNMPFQLQAQLTKKPRILNLGVNGQTLATIYANRTSRHANSVLAGVPNLFVIQGGTNDIKLGATGTNTYANYTTPLITYLKGLGFRVVVCTALYRTDSAYESERLAYNALVRANSGGADHVLDLDANPTMGGTGNASNLGRYQDGVHPTMLGQSYLAGAPSGSYASQHTYYAGLQSALRAATGDAGYTP